LASETRRYEPGQIIFREGEESTAAYVIEVGRVELIKTGRGGLVRLGVLGKGDLFGEMGVLDKGPRSATARAEEDCLLQVIPRADFLRMIEDDPATALNIMTRLAKRLRDTDERLVSGTEPSRGAAETPGTALVPAAPPVATAVAAVPIRTVQPARGGLITRLVRAFRGPRGVQAARRRPKVVAVAPLSLEPEYDQRPFLVESLGSLESITLKASAGDLPPPDEGQAARDPIRARLAARQLMAEEKADLLIWGGEDQTGRVIELQFAVGTSTNPDAVGHFPANGKLVVPADFDDAWIPLIKAVLLTALGDDRPDLADLVDAAAAIGMAPPAGMSAGEQAAVHACFGHAAARAAMVARRRDLLDKAMTSWRLALDRLPREAEDDWAALHRMIGTILQMRGEKGRSETLLREAAGHYEQALEAVHRDSAPQAWASLRVRLATVLFRIDMIAGDDKALKAALAHYQAALAVYSRAEDPWRWADLMTAIGQVLQVYGDHLKSVEVLQKAVDVCRSAIEVRTAEAAPLLYAATRNNMGSALFLLAKHTEDAEYMRLAAVAFRDALAVHRATGSTGPLARTIDKNLRRAEELLQRYESRPVARPAWATEEAPETPLENDETPPPV
jgi:tetratricopeptide (TPR) repeat protein